MNCVMCGAVLPPLNGDTDTRIAVIDGIGFGACAEHFPGDTASDADYERAYYWFIAAAKDAFESMPQTRPNSAPGSP